MGTSQVFNYIVVDGTPYDFKGVVGSFASIEKAIGAVDTLELPHIKPFISADHNVFKVKVWEADYGIGKQISILQVESDKLYKRK